MFSRGGTLPPSVYADARCIDAGIVAKALAETWGTAMGAEFYAKGANVQLGPCENPPLATNNLLEVTDGLRRPSFYLSIHQ